MSNVIGCVADVKFLEHDTGPGHPERPERLKAIYHGLENYAHKEVLVEVPARMASDDELRLVHTEEHIERIRRTQGTARQHLDPDTIASPKSHEVACLAAGAVLAAVDAVFAGQFQRAFAFVRPPGHHAEPDRAMGFCLFNNIAIAAAYALKKYSLRRVLVVDFDVHHGNGTQVAFYDSSQVLYLSTHQYPFYPGTGAFQEVGRGEGTGYTINIPCSAGMDDHTYNKIYAEILAPIAEQYQPELVLVSAGFDPYIDDPLAGMRVTVPGFRGLARTILGVADRCSQGRALFVLEGGYNLDGLRDGALGVLDEMSGLDQPEFVWKTTAPFTAVVQAAKRYFAPYWKL
jgi:acetoin utilization deacetylase AcuC-like enzyme